jgi:threonine aldolase
MYVDLRSDTVTKPSPEMRLAMAQAEVGDDVLGEDPTVHRLEKKAAELLGKEAALFVPTGTMANQLCIRLHTRPGDEIIADENAHIIRYESGAAAALSGVQVCCVKGKRGILSASQVEQAIRPGEYHNPPTTLICLENTHNRGGGTVYPLGTIREIRAVARRHGIAMHLDGARLFNAVVATGTSAAEYAAEFDTVSFCLSKGLGAPVGSMIVSDRDRIAQLRRLRKRFGGGMRQAGILAAAGLFALENNIARISEDHANARRLAAVLPECQEAETNILIFGVSSLGMTAADAVELLKARGVLVSPVSATEVRAVTHLDATGARIEKAIEVFRSVFGARALDARR